MVTRCAQCPRQHNFDQFCQYIHSYSLEGMGVDKRPKSGPRAPLAGRLTDPLQTFPCPRCITVPNLVDLSQTM